MAKGSNILWLWTIVALAMITSCATTPELYAPEVARMDAESVKARINSEGFNLIDARYDSDWESSDRMIAGAVREDPYEVSEWAPKYSNTEVIVVYCA